MYFEYTVFLQDIHAVQKSNWTVVLASLKALIVVLIVFPQDIHVVLKE